MPEIPVIWDGREASLDLARHEFNVFSSQGSPKLPWPWIGAVNLSQWNPIPLRFRPSRRKARRKEKPAVGSSQSVSALQRSFDPLDGVRTLRQRRWSWYDLQHLLTAGFLVFSFAIAPMSWWAKLGAVVGYSVLLLMPATRQFFLPSLPIWAYLLYFFSSRFIPVEYRPHIWVRVLPALENVLYGVNLSNVLSSHTHAALDLLAWVPYGLGHFALPAVTSAALFVFAAPGTVPVFARSFGYLSLLGVTTQLLLPCTPPWYERANGLEPAHYGMPGSPAGLARVDALLGVDMYTTSFTTAPLPFGAFPSLHAADATLEALFLGYAVPRGRFFFAAYVGWVWWATMYLNHHYAVDLVGGSLMSAVVWSVARARFLPRRQPGKSWRWDYDYVDVGERGPGRDEEAWAGGGAYGAYGFGLARDDDEGDEVGLRLLRRTPTTDSDEWTLGSSRSSTGGSASSSSAGASSRSTPDADFGGAAALVGVTASGQVWDGGRVGRDSELSEVLVMR